MALTEKTKGLLWLIVSVAVYVGGLLAALAYSLGGWSKNAAYDTTDERLLETLFYLLGFPVLQYFIGRQLRLSGKTTEGSAVLRSIWVEFAVLGILLFLFMVLLAKAGG